MARLAPTFAASVYSRTSAGPPCRSKYNSFSMESPPSASSTSSSSNPSLSASFKSSNEMNPDFAVNGRPIIMSGPTARKLPQPVDLSDDQSRDSFDLQFFGTFLFCQDRLTTSWRRPEDARAL
eukprot:m.173413 g.173413  ORF g.173413 m.173413 type:complete len:123 (+) comp14847_c1_seq2:6259-6627(+)